MPNITHPAAQRRAFRRPAAVQAAARGKTTEQTPQQREQVLADARRTRAARNRARQEAGRAAADERLYAQFWGDDTPPAPADPLYSRFWGDETGQEG